MKVVENKDYMLLVKDDENILIEDHSIPEPKKEVEKERGSTTVVKIKNI